MSNLPQQNAKPNEPGAASKPRRWRRLARRTLIALGIVALCLGYLLKDYYRTLHSLRRIPGTNAYVMDYYVDYHIDDIRAHGIDVNHIDDSVLGVLLPRWTLPIAMRAKSALLPKRVQTLETGEHCSTIMLHPEHGDVFFGRNFDYFHNACLVLKVHRPDGASSLAVLDLHYLNLDREDLEQTNLFQRLPLLFTPYYLQDGMNEHGVAVADMSVHNVKPPRDPAKPCVIHSLAMRLILDYAHNTDEAVELLKQYNIYFVGETCHLMIADSAGKSVVVNSSMANCAPRQPAKTGRSAPTTKSAATPRPKTTPAATATAPPPTRSQPPTATPPPTT